MKKHALRVLDTKGDTSYEWDTPEEAAAAESVFNELVGRGYIAASMNADGSSGARISAFDAGAGSILLVPILRGG